MMTPAGMGEGKKGGKDTGMRSVIAVRMVGDITADSPRLFYATGISDEEGLGLGKLVADFAFILPVLIFPFPATRKIYFAEMV